MQTVNVNVEQKKQEEENIVEIMCEHWEHHKTASALISSFLRYFDAVGKLQSHWINERVQLRL